MLFNYFKLALRQLWRNRLFTALNVVGLSIGLAACWMIFQLVSYEFSFDADQPNAHRIYKVVTDFTFEGKESGNTGAPKPLADAIRRQIGGVETVAGLYNQWIMSLKVPQASGKPLVFLDIEQVQATTTDYFKMVPYHWLAGSPARALAEPNEVVLTLSRAEKYFPTLTPEQMLGKTILYRDTVAIEVTGVVADLERSTSFTGQEFLSLSTFQKGEKAKDYTETWGGVNSSDEIYLLIGEKTDVAKLNKNINALSQKNSQEAMKNWGGNFSRKHDLLPLSKVHFTPKYAGRVRTVNKNILLALMGLAAFLLVLAVINYVNLTTAQVPQRAREIGIRKTLGSSRSRLIGHFLGETFIVTILACGLAFVWTITFRTSFSDLFPEGLELYPNAGQTLLFMAFLALSVSVLAGWYPSLLITRFQPTQVLRGQVSLRIGRNSFSLRKSLIVFQFVIAQAFVIGAIIMNQQMRYTMEKDLGFDREAVLTFQVPYRLLLSETYGNKQFALKEELKRLPQVAAVSLGNPPFNQNFSSGGLVYKEANTEVERSVYRKYVDTDLLGTYNMKLLAGRNLLPSDTVREYVINETAVREFGFENPQEAVGKFLTDENSHFSIPIVGVVKDFHTDTFSQKIDPLTLMTEKDKTGSFNVKLASSKPADWQAGIREMERLWKQTYPDAPFEYKFYDDMIAQYYESERTMAKIINLSTGIAILISCLGLFGLATLTAFQRTKEIGVRKVLGASIASIVGMLSKDFVLLVLIALVIASPIAWYFMDQWLADFAYHVDISWWVFALAGITAMAIALLTVGYQSVRAALMNPVESLRSE
ncbi:ABC transporter permease [Persicitalea jodogahamensis]|uniref:ABC transporter permease n=1 Tax=Persicitalea jodogahamensis TaxID=402147 RepID=A0A8J3GBR5_9BACT|nr:FtsX-like permease family protein [Persicitalea jodogahamensis]GHB83689.1 ABC transporter permease [Persicitalea jodogahamensis]